MKLINVLGGPVLAFIDHVPEGDFYLLAAAVDAAERGQGTGSMLMDHMEDVAHERGCKRIALDVAANNTGARRLYERRGMVVEAKSPLGFALRMVKEI
jgi:ribosomal protein S18 acetylase RimI-like enzyme